MIKSSIKIVVLPLFIAILLTSFYVMQPQMADAATKRYKNSGSQSDTPLASDRFNDIANGRATAAHSQVATAGPVSDKVELELQQFIDCVTGTVPRGTCSNTVMSMSGTQNVALSPGSTNGYVDVEADLFMLQKDDTLNQDRVNNKITGTQKVEAITTGTGTASVDISHDGNENELNLNLYQYNKRGAIESDDRSTYDIDVEAAVDDEDGGGNDDSKNTNTATQMYKATAAGNTHITAATSGDQDLTVAQFNAGCDDTDPSNINAPIDISCTNTALQDILLQGSGGTAANPNLLNFETLSEIEMQQLNTCGFSQSLNCLNDGTLDVNVVTAGSGEANVELENPNGKPVVFQENECSDLNAGTATNPNDCANISKNVFDVQKRGAGSNIEKTNLDLQVIQANDCDSATARIDCVNTGRTSTVTLPISGSTSVRNIGAEFGVANTIVTVNADGAGSNIEDADPDSFLTMVNDCDGARLSGSQTATCTNSALNEAHFLAGTASGMGGSLDVDRVVQDSELRNNCDNLESTSTASAADFCNNRATNSFTAISTGGAEININEDVTQTHYLQNDCSDAKCVNDALNVMLLKADDGAVIQTIADSEGLSQTTNLLNDCSREATCSNIATNDMSIVADGVGSNVDLSKVNSQEITLINDCHTATTCANNYGNNYDIVNTSGETLTVSADQSIFKYNTGGSFTSDNTINIAKTGTAGQGAYSFTGTQTSNNDPTPFSPNTFNAPNPSSGSCTYSQTNGGSPSYSGQTGTGCT